tara:strand:- start:156 stop:485 length:330 start_codon:yes stop_codon:yes gene_type:complete
VDFKTYQTESRKTAIYPGCGDNLHYPTLGLCGEAGEVAEKVKKLIRDKAGVIDDDFREDMKKETGDVLWYVSALCYELGIDMDEVARMNIDKLQSRQDRGVLQGSGDNR